MKSVLCCILILIILLSCACSGKSTVSSSGTSALSEFSASSFISEPDDLEEPAPTQSVIYTDELFSIVYTEHVTGFKIIYSDLLDTLFIAGALYYDFESPNLCPINSSSKRYRDIQDHFAPYKTHPFIQGFGKYTDDTIQDIDGETVYPLMYYILSGKGFDQWQSTVFKDADEVNAFIADLEGFYSDAGVAGFLKNCPLRQEMLEYIPTTALDMPIAEILLEMESYVGNRGQIYDDVTLHYYSVLSPYRPVMASFYPCDFDDDIYFVAQSAPYSFTDGSLDIGQVVETSVHETLHIFINGLVEKRTELIESLTQDAHPTNYTSQMYINMPWSRIVDEAIVRAVQAGIYRQVYGNSERAYEELLVKEMNAGIANVDKMYETLRVYEANRKTYPTIDDYVETLITVYLQ